MGVGHRFRRTSKREGPSPAAYNLDSSFDNRPKGNAFSFGLSREAYSNVYLKENPRHEKSVPGPGAYNPDPHAQEKSLSFSLRPKTAFGSAFDSAKNSCPGPGNYDVASSISRTGHLFNAKYKTSGAPIIKGNTRFDLHSARRSSQSPGPGHYDSKVQLDPRGNYMYSKFKSSGAPLFCKNARDLELDTSKSRKEVPGPGAYGQVTEFGYYHLEM